VIKSIICQPDFVAELTLVDYSPGIFQADQGPIPEFQSQITRPPVLERLPHV
jgi:hypothetical protein